MSMAYSMMTTTHAQCVPSTFQAPTVFGAEITTIGANLVTNFTSFIPAKYLSNTPAANATDLTFCNVTVSYTHPGQSDNITVMAWLPVGTWNERMEGVGGGGWVAGGTDTPQSYIELVGAISSGYAGITTDAGLNLGLDQSASPWALLSPGNVNLYDLENLASRSLYDEAIIGKSLIKDFYGRPPKKSYWNGCSQGGRQGMMIAQRYPGLYDGIAAAAPAINWNAFFTAMYWPQLIMNLARKHPHGCELDAITAAAVSACDGLDGVIDGVISNVDDCHFNPFKVVGSIFNCSATGTKMHVSEMAAVVANATWSGPATSTGKFLWYGPHIGADISGSLTSLGTAGTNCTGGTCTGAPLYLGAEWITLFIEKNPNFDLTNITKKQYDEIVYSGHQQFASIIETVDPDLSQFRASKGKILTYHGLADPVIPARGSQHYYESVTALDPKVHDFYRLFFAPGIQHCNSGPGGQPLTVLEALVEWVENDISPDSLPVSFQTANGTTYNQILCPYPLKSVHKRGSDPTVAGSYTCA